MGTLSEHRIFSLSRWRWWMGLGVRPTSTMFTQVADVLWLKLLEIWQVGFSLQSSGKTCSHKTDLSTFPCWNSPVLPTYCILPSLASTYYPATTHCPTSIYLSASMYCPTLIQHIAHCSALPPSYCPATTYCLVFTCYPGFTNSSLHCPAMAYYPLS